MLDSVSKKRISDSFNVCKGQYRQSKIAIFCNILNLIIISIFIGYYSLIYDLTNFNLIFAYCFVFSFVYVVLALFVPLFNIVFEKLFLIKKYQYELKISNLFQKLLSSKDQSFLDTKEFLDKDSKEKDHFFSYYRRVSLKDYYFGKFHDLFFVLSIISLTISIEIIALTDPNTLELISQNITANGQFLNTNFWIIIIISIISYLYFLFRIASLDTISRIRDKFEQCMDKYLMTFENKIYNLIVSEESNLNEKDIIDTIQNWYQVYRKSLFNQINEINFFPEFNKLFFTVENNIHFSLLFTSLKSKIIDFQLRKKWEDTTSKRIENLQKILDNYIVELNTLLTYQKEDKKEVWDKWTFIIPTILSIIAIVYTFIS